MKLDPLLKLAFLPLCCGVSAFGAGGTGHVDHGVDDGMNRAESVGNGARFALIPSEAALPKGHPETPQP